MLGSQYLHDLFDHAKRRRIVQGLVRTIRQIEKTEEIDFLVSTGLSGDLIIADVAGRLALPFAVVRKAHAHSAFYVESSEDLEAGQRGLLVDDVIATGRTYRQVERRLRELKLEMIGAVVWRGTWGLSTAPREDGSVFNLHDTGTRVWPTREAFNSMVLS